MLKRTRFRMRELPPTAGLPMHMGDCFRAPEKPFTAGLRDWLGIPEPIMACSGTAAFVVALRTLARRNPGRSRVVVPAYTCPLVPLAVRLAGLRAVACDTLPGGFGIDPGALGRCCDETALAVVPAHLGGRASDISAVSAVAHAYGAVVIEDAAQALGASFGGRSVGLSGDIGFFSLAVGKGLTTYEGGVLFSRDPDLHAELQGTASRVLRPGLLWNSRRVLELLGYAVAYNPALLPLAYGRPLRRGLDRGDEIAAVGDAFTLDDIPLHRMDPLRLRVAANALERLPAFLEAGRNRAVRRAGMLERAGAEVLRDDPGGEGIWPFCMVLMPDRDRRDRALGALWRSGFGVSKLFVRALPDYPYLAGAVEGGPCPAARDLAGRMLTVTNTHWLDDAAFARLAGEICHA